MALLRDFAFTGTGNGWTGWTGLQREQSCPIAESFQSVDSGTVTPRWGTHSGLVRCKHAYSPFGWNESTEFEYFTVANGPSHAAGNEYYYGLSVRFISPWVDTSGWQIFFQWYTDTTSVFGGPPPMQLECNQRRIRCRVLAGLSGHGGPWEIARDYTIEPASFPLNTWIDLIGHARWAKDLTGIVQWWKRVDGIDSDFVQVVNDTAVATLRWHPDHNGGAADPVDMLKMGFYRASNCAKDASGNIGDTLSCATGDGAGECEFGLQAGKGTQSPNKLYFSGFAIGETFNDVRAKWEPSGDVTAPTLSSAQTTVDGASVQLVYSETLDSSSVPATSDFSVTVGGNARAVSSVSIFSTTVTLLLASPVTAAQNVRVWYTAGALPIQDVAGNDAANLSNQAVTNNVSDLWFDTLPALSGSDVRRGASSDGSVVAYSGRGALTAHRKRVSSIVLDQELDIHTIWQFVEASSGSQAVRHAIWDNDGAGGAPGTRRALTSEVTVSGPVTPTKWLKRAVSPVVRLTGTIYVGVHSGDTTSVVSQAQESLSSGGFYNDDAYGDGTSDPFGSPSVFNARMSIAVEGTPTGGGPPPPTDTTPPELESASVVGPHLTLDYNEPLDNSSVPATSAFTVTVAAVARAIDTVAVASDTVTLTLAQPMQPGEADPLLSYTVPGTNPIQDLAGNDAAALTSRTVVNETTGDTSPIQRLSGTRLSGTRLTGTRISP